MPALGMGLGVPKGSFGDSGLLLDELNESMDVAFSLRKVRADYNGPCVRVRNNAGTLKDIGFLSNGSIDEAALNAHCGANDGTVQTWYNQSAEGGRFNAVQDTSGNQPIIYDASEGGYLGYLQNTGNMYLRLENKLTGVTDLSVVYENVSSTTSSAYVLGEHRSDGSAADGVAVGHPTVPGFSLVSGGANIIGHTGGATGEKHAGFGYTSGSTKFSVVDGYVVSSTTATFGSIDLDYIFSRSKSDNPDNWDFLGKIWEVFLSTSDLSGDRIAIENSILSANGLTVPEQTLLEKYDGAEGAFSTRCINREHVGPIIEVRATQTTEVTEDVYLDYTGVVNKSRITSLCTDDEDSNALVDGFVETWYDQSSFGYDVTNTTDAQQPKIHDATNGIVLLNGQPAVEFDGSNDILESSSQTINLEAIIAVASTNDESETGQHILRHGQGFIRFDGSNHIEYRNNNDLRDDTAGNFLGLTNDNAVLVSWYTKGTNFNDENASWKWYVNGDLLGTKTGNNFSSEGSPIKLGAQTPTSERLNGKICEAIIIDKRNAHYDRADQIHKDINSHYLIYQEATASPSSGFLSDYDGAAAAFSVRQLGDANLCMRVRRSGDSAEKNIGFGTDGFVDTAAISDFCGSDDGFVVTWFDQSGNAVDATQATPGSQPKIYDGTDGIVKENGIVAIEFDIDYLSSPSTQKFDEISVFVTAIKPNTQANSPFVSRLGNGAGAGTKKGDFHLRSQSAFIRTISDNTDGSQYVYTEPNTHSVFSFLWDGSVQSAINTPLGDGEAAVRIDSTIVDQTAADGNFNGGNDELRINATHVVASDLGRYQEVLLFNTNKASSVSDIEENINDAFNVYPSTDTTPESGFLSEFSGVSAAYSVRKLGDSPVCMRVRKTVSSVDYYQVIGFDSNGDLDTAAIEEFGGSTDVFVQTWYDQSGNGRHQEQDTNSEQPKIYDGTDGFYYAEGNVAIWFNDQAMEDSSDDQITVLDQSVFAVAELRSTQVNDRAVFVGHSESGTYQVYAAQVWNGTTNNDPDEMVNYAGTIGDRGTLPLALEVRGNLRTYGWHHDSDTIFQYNGEEYSPDQDQNAVLAPTQSTYQISVGSNSYNPLNAYVTEVIVYEGMRDATTRTNIEKNQNEHFLVHQSASASPDTGLLSEAPGAKVAFSTRQLGDALLCMKVASGATGNPTKNIGFKNGVVDTAAIEEFCGSNDGFVATWYDQSGNDNNAVQNTHPARPKIFDSQSGIAKDNNGKPTTSFSTDGYTLDSEIFLKSDDPDRYLISLVAKARDEDGAGEYFAGVTSNSLNFFDTQDSSSYYRLRLTSEDDTGNKNTTFRYPDPAFTDDKISSFAIYADSGEHVLKVNGIQLTSTGAAVWSDSSDSKINIGKIGRGYSANMNNSMYSEFAVWENYSDGDVETVGSNVNNYYKTNVPSFNSGLLDSYPGAAAAYSLRRLSSTYTGAAIEVTSNGSTQDIGFDIEGNLDTSALINFCGANDGRVSKWYDQSGNGNDLVQATANDQPKIYDGTDGLVKISDEPAIEFYESNAKFLESSSNITVDDFFVLNVIKKAGHAGGDTLWAFGTSGDTEFQQLANLNNNEDYYIRRDNGSGTNINSYIGKQVDFEGPHNVVSLSYDQTNPVLRINGKVEWDTDASDVYGASNQRIVLGENPQENAGFRGKQQEFLVYPSDMRTKVAGIEKNINKHYKIYEQPLLDVAEDAAVAFSLRRLRSDYTGPAINVFNGTDYKDIYFKANGTLDTNAISKFCGSNDGRVAVWYDQSGNNFHFSQTSDTLRPTIYTSGAVFTSNSKPSIKFIGDVLTNTDSIVSTASELWVSWVARRDTDSEGFSNRGLFDTFGDRTVFDTQVSGWLYDGTYSSSPIDYNNEQKQAFLDLQDGDGKAYVNGVLHDTDVYALSAITSDNRIGFGGTNYILGDIQEFIIWSTNQSENRKVVESNMNHYYSVY